MQEFTDQELEQVSGGIYTQEQAVNRALGNAGLRMDQVQNLKFEGNEVSFSFNHTHYSYKMDMNTGSILHFERHVY